MWLTLTKSKSKVIYCYCFNKINEDLTIDGFSDPNCTKGINKIRIHKGVKFMFAEPKKKLCPAEN